MAFAIRPMLRGLSKLSGKAHPILAGMLAGMLSPTTRGTGDHDVVRPATGPIGQSPNADSSPV